MSFGMIHGMEELLQQKITDALRVLGISGVSFALEFPAELAHGDYATNVALVAAKKAGMNPRSLAEKIVAELGDIEGVEKIEVAGPGFINFTLAREYFSQSIQSVDEEWGKNQNLKGRRVVVEYSCPNPFKEMHIGHLMSTVIGEAVSRLVEYSGASLVRDSYGGDVGPHVAKALWGLRSLGVGDRELTPQKIGEAYAYGANAYEDSEDAKKDIDALNVAIYKGEDAELMELWRKGKEVSVLAFKELYKKLGTHFDRFFFESETASLGMQKVEEGLAKGIFEKSEGAVIYPGEKKGLHTLVFVTSRGTPTYEAKEVGLAFLKEQEFPSDASYILTASEQVGHFQVVKAALAELDEKLAKKTHHIPHGFLRLPEGKMSSRTGNVITAESLITEAIKRASEKNEDAHIAEVVGVAAVKYAILRAKPGSDVVFDMNQALSIEGDSGPYLQYSYVRAKSVLEKASSQQSATSSQPEDISHLERLLPRFPHVVARASHAFEPHFVTTYLTELASAFNSWYASEKIIGVPNEAHKLTVVRAFAQTMKNGLWLLGIQAPEKM